MPAVPATSLLNTLEVQNTTAVNATSDALQVICAWPVSGQYGPGSRGLYYVLILACVFARKTEWLRNACLAAVLIFPAVASLHGIVLAAIHIDGAVDMDVFGAFQLCSIGILAAPVMVRRSGTYFYDPGRNTIFLWTGLILAGLLSLTVEFFRLEGVSCDKDDAGNPFFPDLHNFPYGTSLCGLHCAVGDGPVSPMRGGSANNIYVVPVPTILTFNTATLLAAACCIPAILSLISMWNKILKINWKSRFGAQTEGEQIDEVIEGTNGATMRKMSRVNGAIRFFLSTVELLILGGAVLAIIITGERNFFSYQVNYQTEPMANIGQWAPIVGAGLAALGSLYLRVASDLEAVDPKAHANGSTPEVDQVPETASVHSAFTAAVSVHTRPSFSNSRAGDPTALEMVPTATEHPQDQGLKIKRSWTQQESGSRGKVAKTLTRIGNYLGTASPDQFDDSEFRHGRALEWPEIPGEQGRNSALHQTREKYNPERDLDGSVTPTNMERRSRAESFTGSTASGFGIEGGSSSRTPSPLRPRASTLSVKPVPYDAQDSHSPSSAGPTGRRPQPRRDTLEVPAAVHHNVSRNEQPSSPITSRTISMPQGPSSPAIVVSSEDITSSPTSTRSFNFPVSSPPTGSPKGTPAPGPTPAPAP